MLILGLALKMFDNLMDKIFLCKINAGHPDHFFFFM